MDCNKLHASFIVSVKKLQVNDLKNLITETTNYNSIACKLFLKGLPTYFQRVISENEKKNFKKKLWRLKGDQFGNIFNGFYKLHLASLPTRHKLHVFNIIYVREFFKYAYVCMVCVVDWPFAKRRCTVAIQHIFYLGNILLKNAIIRFKVV